MKAEEIAKFAFGTLEEERKKVVQTVGLGAFELEKIKSIEKILGFKVNRQKFGRVAIHYYADFLKKQK